MKILCRKCKEFKDKSSQVGKLCVDCYKAYLRNYQAVNRERIALKRKDYDMRRNANPLFRENERKRGRAYWAKLRHEVFMAYGGYICNCCGETEPLFLSIDHVNNDGAKHRRQLGYNSGNGKGASSRTWKWLKDNNYPEGFQVLCMNCNLGKARNKGKCPHQSKPFSVNRVNSVNIHNTGEFMDNTEPSPILIGAVCV